MNELTDLLLNKPIGEVVLDGLLFLVFAIHLTFVLTMIGTAILGFYFFIETWWGGKLKERRWDKEILQTFLAHKSLAVVIGVGALLLIQVGYTIPFFTSVSLFAPFWMLIIGLLIVSFIFFDALAHRIYTHHYLHLTAGIIALGCLLIVPGIFVAVLVSSENSGHWMSIINNGFRLSGAVSTHWVFRYLHIIGAAVVLGAVFHYFFSTRSSDTQGRKSTLLKWVVGGLLFQIVVGVFLYGSVPNTIDTITNIFLLLGILAALMLLWFSFFRVSKGRTLGTGLIVALSLLILVPMLIGRQFIQDKGVKPLHAQTIAKKAEYKKTLEPYVKPALAHYRETFGIVYNNGSTIYNNSCAFCHGSEGKGNGKDAGDLTIPPEELVNVRTTREHLYRILVHGVDGTGMPYFAYFDKGKLEDLMRYLNENFNMLGEISPLPVTVSEEADKRAHEVFNQVCHHCHGPKDKVAEFSLGFKPAPTDFAVYNLEPKRAFEIITNGYPGTIMVNYGMLPEDVRWGLVKMVNDMFKKNAKPNTQGG